jgi:hypothetical protein
VLVSLWYHGEMLTGRLYMGKEVLVDAGGKLIGRATITAMLGFDAHAEEDQRKEVESRGERTQNASD